MNSYGYCISEPDRYYKYDSGVMTCCDPPQYTCVGLDGKYHYITCTSMAEVKVGDPRHAILEKAFRLSEESERRMELNDRLSSELTAAESKVKELETKLEASRKLVEMKANELVELSQKSGKQQDDNEQLMLMLYGEKKYGERVEKPQFTSFGELREAYPEIIDSAFSIGLNNYKVELIRKVESLLKDKAFIEECSMPDGRERACRFFMTVVKLISQNSSPMSEGVARLRAVVPEVLAETMLSHPQFIGKDWRWREWIIKHFTTVFGEMFDYILSCKDSSGADSVLKYMDLVNAGYKANVEHAQLCRLNRTLWGDDILLTDEDGRLKELKDIISDNQISGSVYGYDVKCALYGSETVVSEMMKRFRNILQLKG